jgi:hypothetical protein
MFRTVLVLFDHSGNTSNFYRSKNFEVIQVDTLVDGLNAIRLEIFKGLQLEALICYPPCTYFSKARKKPDEFDLDYGLSTLDLCFRLYYLYKPRVFMIENPFHSRIRRFIGEPQQVIALGTYGFRSEKLTGLWGNFINAKIGTSINYKHTNGKLDTLSQVNRSVTPLGFIEAFYRSNF